jgi:hypothetical protein
MPTQADFLNDPWDFLRHHIVLMGMEGYGDAGVKWFKLTRLARNTAYAVSTVSQIKSDVFQLDGHRDGPTDGYFQAYWCPYQREETKYAVIGTAANFCFTAQISGCSIGLGHETDTGHTLIIHSNRGSTPAEGLTVAQSQEQDIRRLAEHTLRRVFGPSDYRLDSKGRARYQGTVVGWRGPNGAGPWQFRAQIYEHLPQITPRKYRLRKLVKM